MIEIKMIVVIIMELIESLTEKKWNEFAAASADGGLLQSWNWGSLQEANGKKIWRLAFEYEGRIAAAVLLVRQPLPGGFCYLYAPRGPIFNYELRIKNEESWGQIISAVKDLAKKERVLFVRLEPPQMDAEAIKKSNLRYSGEVQPKKTLILDLSLSEQELLAQMKAKTRYNIKVAEKHQIKVEFYSGQEKFEDFWRLMQQTAERDQITVHSAEYYKKMLSLPEVKLVLTTYDGQTVATAIMAVFGTWAYYLHGGSDYAARDKMAPYLLQWSMINAAKQAGCRYYDFWGADAVKWPGVTRFKVGFAPARPLTEFPGAYDLVLRPIWYYLYQIALRFRFKR